MEGKVCKRCDEFLDFSNFYKNKANKDGFHSYCKECAKKASTKWQKDNHEKKYNSNKKKRENNPEYHREHGKKHRENNKEKIAMRLKEWQQENKDRIKGYNDNRRKNKSHEISKDEWIRCKEYFDNSCAYCGLTHSEHLDIFKQDLHKEHVDHEGANDLSNCVPACKSCNSSKHSFKFEEWYTEDNEKYSNDREIKIYNWLLKDYKL